MSKVLRSATEKTAQAMEVQMQKTLSSYMTSYIKNLTGAFSVDAAALTKAFKLNMDENEMQSFLTTVMTAGTDTLESNLTSFGYAADDDLSAVTIYPYDFESKEQVTSILTAYNQKMRDGGEDEKVISYTDVVGSLMSSVTSIINSIRNVLIAFVSISLIVSSIMIGVITYISVFERRQEIGILRAMGASKRNVAQVFNAETFIIGLMAGVMGVVLSALLDIPLNMIIAYFSDSGVTAYLPLSSGVVLVILSVILTLIGGLLPARKASKSDPVLALRSE